MKVLVIKDSENNGFYNMAVDICSMKLVRSRAADAVFRTYLWKPHCLSIGRFQKPEAEADVKRLRSNGYHIVKRPTGGRAVWHGDELTYSLVAREDFPLVSGGIEESLRKVAGLLTEALNASGIPAVMNRKERELTRAGRKHNPCFTSHGRSEIMTPDGRKLVGSAQARSRGVFIEHGSILFSNQQVLTADYLPKEAASTGAEMKAVLKAAVGTIREYNPLLTREDLAEQLHREFAKSVSVHPVETESSDLPGLQEEIEERRLTVEHG